MNWQTTYPTLATVMQASPQTLLTWDEQLPPPQTDVELTIRSRIRRLLDAELRKEAPHIADPLDKLWDVIEKATGRKRP